MKVGVQVYYDLVVTNLQTDFRYLVRVKIFFEQSSFLFQSVQCFLKIHCTG